jgi:EF-hand domain pair
MVLPCEDNLLRNFVQDRPTFRVGRYEYLPRDIERGLSEIIERELTLLRKLEILKSDLEVRHDFSIYAAYRVIDRYNEGAINTFNLSSFLKNNGYHATEKELLCIIRRIDTDGDAKISYIEFADFMRSTEPRAWLST